MTEALSEAATDRELLQHYQAVRCGSLAVAFPYGWATAIVDRFELTPIPKAPAWLIGATNIDGRILPVVDLSRYGVRGQRAQRATDLASTNQHHRLLIGGLTADSGERRMGIYFDGLPQQISQPKQVLESVSSVSNAAMTQGTIVSAQGERFAIVNIDRLFEQLAAELGTL
ncbi:MAG: chemotaxis protein CheW [Casimicrobium sp.]